MITHDDIVERVRTILNEHGGDDAVSIATDRVLLEDYIKSAIPDAVVMLAQKGYRVNVKHIVLPDSEQEFEDFISLISYEKPLWKKVVTKITERDSPEYVMAQNEFTKPGVNSPIVFIDSLGYLRALPQPTLEDLRDDPNVAKSEVYYNAKYDGGTLNAGEKEAAAVCYMTAALVLGMFGDDNGKQRLSDISMNMLQ